MANNKETFYITTPIYYPSGKLHIGHSYTTVAADCMARFKKMMGYDVMFLTGTDEHGQKIERRARSENKAPQEFVDEIVDWIKDLWEVLDINYNDFIRTTEERHKKVVQKIFLKFYEQGDVYKDTYEGWYCTPCESFWLERQLEGRKLCPDCQREVEWVKEESYFFKMSKYADKLLEHIENNPDFIQPPERKNEMINNFLKPGLQDLCVSRTTFKWGIPVPMDLNHVIYVWLDALTNYITALGFLTEDESKFEKYWPCDVQLVGKEIVRFHTIYWPIFLMALDVTLPKQVFGHGWLLLEDGKISKSKGNIIDPKILSGKYGSDAVRFYLLREIPFGSDGVFTPESLIERINYDLANDLGNLLHRTVAMVDKYFDGNIPASGKIEDIDEDLKTMAIDTPKEMVGYMNNLRFSDALESLWRLIRRTNKYIDETRPWILGRDKDDDKEKEERLKTVLYNLSESIRIISVMLWPFMPRTPKKIWEQLGLEDDDLIQYESVKEWGSLKAGQKVKKDEPLFPRLEIGEELEKLSIEREESEKTSKDVGTETAKSNSHDEDEELMQLDYALKDYQATIDDFTKLDIRVAEITGAEPVKGADKLLKLEMDLGFEKRQVVAGIAKSYQPEELQGKKTLLVVNLKPTKIKGIKSEGMILAASDIKSSKDDIILTSLDDVNISKGSKVE